MAEEHFDARTTFDYLTKLGKNFGQIYVNDAPLACLTTSNSVAEIKCDRKVMGFHMTEIVRKLAQFFLKKYPLDVHERHIKRPDYQGYFEHKFTAFLGGNSKTPADIIDKILLANSLLDHAS